MFFKTDIFKKFSYQVIHIICRIPYDLQFLTYILADITDCKYFLKRSPDKSQRCLDFMDYVGEECHLLMQKFLILLLPILFNLAAFAGFLPFYDKADGQGYKSRYNDKNKTHAQRRCPEFRLYNYCQRMMSHHISSGELPVTKAQTILTCRHVIPIHRLCRRHISPIGIIAFQTA